MFESIIIRNKRNLDADKPIDLGFLAEALIFYQSVKIIADKAILKQLIHECGHEILLELIENRYLTIEYLDNGLAIQTQNTNTPNERHHPIVYSLPSLALDVVSPELFREYTGKSGKGRRISQRFLRNVSSLSLDPHNLPDEVLIDFSDSNYVEQSIIHLVKNYTPEYPNPETIKFQLHRDGKSLLVNTNIDFVTLNKFYHLRIPPTHSSMSPAYLLSHLFNLRGDIYFCTKFQSEITTDLINERVFNIKYADLLQRQKISEDALRLFQNFLFEDSKAVCETMNRGERTFKDLLELISKAKKFQKWLAGKEPDSDLLKEYYKEVTAGSWVDKLPARTARWSLFTGVGLAIDALGGGGLGTAASLAISAGDAFIVDSIIGGWKPNQFIDNEVKKFVKK